jgi:pilus assembly protein CpaE
MRTLIVSDQADVARDVREYLQRHGLDCHDDDIVPVDRALDRFSRTIPELLIVVLPEDPAAGLESVRSASSLIQNIHVLVVGPATDPKMILRTLHEGADEYLDCAQLVTELPAALGRLKARKAAKTVTHRPGRIISVMAPSGGSGSSMLATSMSTILASQYQECGLVDLRLSAGDLTSMLDLQPAHNLSDLCNRVTRLDPSMFEQLFTRHESGVWLLAAPTRLADIKRITLKGVRHMLALGRMRFPYLVVDVDNSMGENQIETLWQSDVIVLVLRLDYTSVRNTRRVLDNFRELGIGTDRVQLVANSCGQRRQLRLGQAEKVLGMSISHRIPSDPARVNGAINRGMPVTMHYPSAAISKSISGLAISVNGRHQA